MVATERPCSERRPYKSFVEALTGAAVAEETLGIVMRPARCSCGAYHITFVVDVPTEKLHILRALALGMDNHGFVAKYGKSPWWLRNFLSDLCQQVGAKNRTHLTTAALYIGLLKL